MNYKLNPLFCQTLVSGCSGFLKQNVMKSEEQKAQFGKYKGKLISWIVDNDFNYAMWLWKGSNCTTKTKRAAQSLINKKQKNVII